MIGFIQVLLTFVAIGLLIFMIMKKAYAPMSLLALGFIILFFWSLLTGQSIMGEESVGNWFLDIFEFMKSYFCSQYIGLGMILLPLMGFTRYMNHIHATEMLTSLCSKPLQNQKSLCYCGLHCYFRRIIGNCNPIPHRVKCFTDYYPVPGPPILRYQ